MSQRTEAFSSRWVMMLAMLGMAVGTGNIWRFPRIAAQNGGGEFIVAWVAFLLLWSIPLILVEFGAGRKTRAGPVGAFIQLLGPRWAWMGAFIAFVAVAIMFYYSVVAGWTLRYVVASALGEIPGAEPGAFWQAYTTSWWPVITHGVAMGAGAFVVARGVRAIERVASVLMPILLVLVVVLAARAVTLPHASGGLAYLFSVDWGELANAEIWLQALTQNAWDTGAGWGLVLTYAAYLRPNEDTALNAFVLPTANNTVSLLAGIMVLCTVFAVVPDLVAQLAVRPDALSAYPELAGAVRGGAPLTSELIQRTIFASGNEGLTFIWMPQLFASIPLGRLFMLVFFVALAFAAFTSLIAMIELGTRVLRDAGVPRARDPRRGDRGIPPRAALGVLPSGPPQSGLGVGRRPRALRSLLRHRGDRPRRAPVPRGATEPRRFGHPSREVVGPRDRRPRAASGAGPAGVVALSSPWLGPHRMAGAVRRGERGHDPAPMGRRAGGAAAREPLDRAAHGGGTGASRGPPAARDPLIVPACGFRRSAPWCSG